MAVRRHFDVGQRWSARSRDSQCQHRQCQLRRFTAGRHHHASRLRMRTGHDTGCWCLRSKNHQTPSPQVYSLDRGRLRRVALLLKGRAITARNVLQRYGPFHVRYWPSADSPIWPARFAFSGQDFFLRRECRSRPKADYAYQKGARLINSRNAPIGI